MDYRERWELKEYQSEKRLGRRVHLLEACIAVLLLAYLLVFWHLQVTRSDEYRVLAENNRLRRIPVPPNRGAIFDRSGRVLASTRPALNLVVSREGLSDRQGQLSRLESVLGLEPDSLSERLEAMRGRPTFEPLVVKEDASLSELARVEARREWFPSVEVEEASLRDYPEGRSIAHALGYVGEVSPRELEQLAGRAVERGDIVGKAGLEASYDEILRGRRGWKLVTVNNLGRPLGESRTGRDPLDGRKLDLTLDARMQAELVEALGEETGAGIFLDVRTGEVLALASTPAFDPNVFAGRVAPDAWRAIAEDPKRPLHDRAIGSFYAPGSTFKILMSVVGLESGVITPDTVIHCSGSANHYGRPFLCWKKGGHGSVRLHEALVHSCNVYYYEVGRRAGIEAIHKYGSMFHLGRLTGIDLPGERGGILPSDAWKRKARGEPWYPGDTISVSIGQGLLAVTPVQMATLAAAVANGGTVVTPHLVRDRTSPVETLGVRPETLSVIRDALADVVAFGTGRRAALGPLPVAGKTGTAQVFKKSAGIDADKLPKDERDHAWFVGYAPADAPEVAFAVVVEHGGHGGTTAAPVARRVLEIFFADRLPAKRPPELEAGAGTGAARGAVATASLAR
jgi:penicillin-binding protein 2